MGTFKNRMIITIATATRRLRFPFRDKLLRIIYNPDRRTNDFFETVIKYEGFLMKIKTSLWIEWEVFFKGYYGYYTHKTLEKYVSSGDDVFDVGAYTGGYSLLIASKVGKSGKVFSFEPHPDAYKRLKENITLNNLKNVYCRKEALSDKTGNAVLSSCKDKHANKGQSSLIRDCGGKKYKVNVTRIDEFIRKNRIKKCDFIKIDVEGADDLVIKGAMKTIKKFRPIILFEFDNHQLQPVRSSLLKLGYVLFDARKKKLISEKHIPHELTDILCLPQGVKLK